jgi:hypothetical protein
VEAEDGISRIKLRGCGKQIVPPLKVRIHSVRSAGTGGTPTVTDFAWDGDADLELSSGPDTAVETAVELPAVSQQT